MRPTIRAESIAEQFGLWLNLIPTPAAEAMFGMGIARVVMAGQRLGIYRELARTPASESSLAEACSCRPEGLRHLMRCLVVLGHLSERGGLYNLTPDSRKWLDPHSPTYLGTFLEFNYDQWEWWSSLEEILRDGAPRDIHTRPPDDPYWRRYISAMFELSRLSAPEVARKITLPRSASRILDAAGGHGWYAAEICRRFPGVEAVVMDLPGSVAVGKEILARTDMRGWVRHVTADLLTDELGGPYDAVLCFQLVHHLTSEQNRALFGRFARALRAGGALAVMDYFDPPAQERPDSASFLGLHFFLTSASTTYTAKDLESWAAEAGLSRPRSHRLRSVPIQRLYLCSKR